MFTLCQTTCWLLSFSKKFDLRLFGIVRHHQHATSLINLPVNSFPPARVTTELLGLGTIGERLSNSLKPVTTFAATLGDASDDVLLSNTALRMCRRSQAKFVCS